MKKLIVAVTLLILLASCEKQFEGQCGVVKKHYIELNQYATGGFQYMLTVKFDSGKTRNVQVDEYTYFNFAAGSKICF